MKNTTHFETVLLQAVFITALVWATSSCKEEKMEEKGQKMEETKVMAEEHNEAKFENKAAEKDAEFLVKAAEINLEEIDLGRLAQKTNDKAYVKELGKMMEDQHNKSMNELTALANKKSITIPTMLDEKGQKAYEKLSAKSGKDFDKEYCSMMVKGHKEAIKMFEKASTDCSDPDIKAWAAATLPTLHTHLEHAIMCEKKCNKASSGLQNQVQPRM